MGVSRSQFVPSVEKSRCRTADEVDVASPFYEVYPVLAQYFRIRITNVTANQTALRLETIFQPTQGFSQARIFGPKTLSATNDRLDIPVGTYSGVGFEYDPGPPFSGTIVCAFSYDGGSEFSQWCPFVDPQTGNIYAQAGYVAVAESASRQFQILAPAGCTHVRVFLGSATGGAAVITATTSSVPAFDPIAFAVQVDGAIPEPDSAIQIGGSASAGGQFNAVRVENDFPVLSRYGLCVRPIGHSGVTGTTSAGSYQMLYVGGRDPTNNIMEAMQVRAAAISSAAWAGVIVRPYMASDGTNTVPVMDADARRGFQEITRWLGSTAPTVGQKTMASSVPVVIASDQTSLPVNTKTALTPASPTAATVGVASAQAVATNSSRKGLILVNTSANRISLGFGATAVLDSGVTLYPGGSFSMGEYDFYTGAVNAIASAASSNLAIQEYS